MTAEYVRKLAKILRGYEYVDDIAAADALEALARVIEWAAESDDDDADYDIVRLRAILDEVGAEAAAEARRR